MPTPNGKFLDFERPIAELEAKLDELRHVSDRQATDLNADVERLQRESRKLTEGIFAALSPWQKAQMARHPLRPHTTDYIQRMCTDFEELHGDREFADDPSIVGGLARLDGLPIMVIGHEKGRDTQHKIKCSFGMPRPEGYRKARRLMRMAERFHVPILTFIDTPGAYPGVGAEQRNQGEAIAGNLALMCDLTVPSVSVVIGEGGSGGALALGVTDRVCMQQYSTYSVISPEGCASILWKDAEKAEQAASILGITSDRLMELGFIDVVIEEPLGGAHRCVDSAAHAIQVTLQGLYRELLDIAPAQRLEQRRQRFLNFGFYTQD